MPTRPTKDTTAVNMELPADLMARVRDFARRDMRSIKAEFVRALQSRIEELDTTTQRMFQMISEKDGHISRLQALNLELQEHIRNFQAIVGEKDAHIENLRREVEVSFWKRIQRKLRL